MLKFRNWGMIYNAATSVYNSLKVIWKWSRHFPRILFSRAYAKFRNNKTLKKISENTAQIDHIFL